MPDIQGLNVGGTDFDIDDPNDVATDGGELLDTVINYESATTPTIGSFTAFLNQFVSGTKVGQWFKNFRAGCDFILHIGSIVNNCVTDNEALPLSAAQGKVLMDELTQVKSDLSELSSWKRRSGTNLQFYYNDMLACVLFMTGNLTLEAGVQYDDIFALPDGISFYKTYLGDHFVYMPVVRNYAITNSMAGIYFSMGNSYIPVTCTDSFSGNGRIIGSVILPLPWFTIS